MKTTVNVLVKMFSYADAMDWMTNKTPGELPQN